MSKKVSMESKCVGWSDLPAELLAIISDGLEEGTDVTRFRGVCQSWRSSVKPIPNKLSPLFPHRLSSGCLDPYPEICGYRPNYIVANAIYLVKNNRNPKASAFMISLQEYEAGKLLLRHALTYHHITGSIIGSSLDCSGWSLTRFAISHSFHLIPSETKLVLVQDPDFPHDNSEAMALFYYSQPMFALRRCLSNNAHTQLVAGAPSQILDCLNFNGCIYAIDAAAHVYVLDHTTTALQLVRLTCVNFPVCRLVKPKCFVVSDGDLFLVFSVLVSNENPPRECNIYKLIMDDINAKCYHLKKVYDLGDRVFFINRDCAFSVSTRDLNLPPHFVGNCIFVAEGLGGCSQGYRIYHVGGGFRLDHIGGRRARKKPPYSALFKPPSLWIDQLQLEKKKFLPIKAL